MKVYTNILTNLLVLNKENSIKETWTQECNP